jgi:PTH1 family peptidyl-tRNA hydrolase
LDEVLDEVLAGLSLIQRLGYERAGNRLNGFIAPAAAKMLEASSRSELLP